MIGCQCCLCLASMLLYSLPGGGGRRLSTVHRHRLHSLLPFWSHIGGGMSSPILLFKCMTIFGIDTMWLYHLLEGVTAHRCKVDRLQVLKSAKKLCSRIVDTMGGSLMLKFVMCLSLKWRGDLLISKVLRPLQSLAFLLATIRPCKRALRNGDPSIGDVGINHNISFRRNSFFMSNGNQARAKCYKTFYDHTLLMFVKWLSVCPWQAGHFQPSIIFVG